MGIRGDAAAAGPAALDGISIPWMAAWTVFIGRSLPQSVGDTRKVFYRSVEMPRLCLGALVSLIYNRGTSMTDTEPQRWPYFDSNTIRMSVRACAAVIFSGA